MIRNFEQFQNEGKFFEIKEPETLRWIQGFKETSLLDIGANIEFCLFCCYRSLSKAN